MTTERFSKKGKSIFFPIKGSTFKLKLISQPKKKQIKNRQFNFSDKNIQCFDKILKLYQGKNWYTHYLCIYFFPTNTSSFSNENLKLYIRKSRQTNKKPKCQFFMTKITSLLTKISSHLTFILTAAKGQKLKYRRVINAHY